MKNAFRIAEVATAIREAIGGLIMRGAIDISLLRSEDGQPPRFASKREPVSAQRQENGRNP